MSHIHPGYSALAHGGQLLFRTPQRSREKSERSERGPNIQMAGFGKGGTSLPSHCSISGLCRRLNAIDMLRALSDYALRVKSFHSKLMHGQPVHPVHMSNVLEAIARAT